jgi:hypothetical protein
MASDILPAALLFTYRADSTVDSANRRSLVFGRTQLCLYVMARMMVASASEKTVSSLFGVA